MLTKTLTELIIIPKSYPFLPTKHIVSDESASGRSMSAGSTSEFGHVSLPKIIEV